MCKSLNLAERTGLGSSRIPLKMGACSRCSAVNALYRFPPKGWLRPLSFRLFDWIRQRRALPDVRIEALSWFIQHPVLDAGLRHSGIEQLIAFPAAKVQRRTATGRGADLFYQGDDAKRVCFRAFDFDPGILSARAIGTHARRTNNVIAPHLRNLRHLRDNRRQRTG